VGDAGSVVVVGSGPTGANVALSALERGLEVTMVDVGRTGGPVEQPDASFRELRHELADPAAYFLGAHGEGVAYAAETAGYFGFPPSKTHVFASEPGFSVEAEGFKPYVSFARGGLAEAWTGGVYRFNDAELAAFPFSYAELEPYYALIAARIGISGEHDDLDRFAPLGEVMPPLRLDAHSKHLLDRYARRRASLNRRGVYVGRSRIATLTEPLDDRGACTYLGRCFWGCPVGALYTASATLRRCLEHPRFRYVSDQRVRVFAADGAGRVTHVETASGERFAADAFVLGAGTLGTAKIVLDSVHAATGEVVVLSGLTDNRQLALPFLSPRLVGRAAEEDAYQYHQVAMTVESPDDPAANLHAQITTLKSGQVHRVLQTMPIDMKSAIRVFRSVHAALGMVNAWLPEKRRSENAVTIRPRDGAESELVVRYAAGGDEREVEWALRSVKRTLRELGCIAPPHTSQVLPRGSSAHYGGTLPMLADGGDLTCTPAGRLRPYENLYVADASVLPYLPAKNSTLTVMANAVRIADGLLRGEPALERQRVGEEHVA
jgi:choline dehydrogenase-like flavoprotein